MTKNVIKRSAPVLHWRHVRELSYELAEFYDHLPSALRQEKERLGDAFIVHYISNIVERKTIATSQDVLVRVNHTLARGRINAVDEDGIYTLTAGAIPYNDVLAVYDLDGEE